MTPAQDLQGRHAVVTGGSRGLGRAIAERLAASGAQILIVDLPDAIAAASLPTPWRVAAVDVAAADSLQTLRGLADESERVDIVVANAGVVPPWRGVAELDAQEWQRVMAVNSWGVAATLGGFAPALARSPCGSAIVMASINGFRGHPAQVLYTASKHAVVGIMRAAALDLGRQGVRVNALAPGPIATDALISRINTRAARGGPPLADALASHDGETALGRMATTEDVANTAHWLAGDASGAITGVVLPVEAGLG